MTAYGTMESAVQAMRFGAYDFLNKPFDSMDKVSLSVSNALERKFLRLENKELKKLLKDRDKSTTIIAKSKAMKDIISSVPKLSLIHI